MRIGIDPSSQSRQRRFRSHDSDCSIREKLGAETAGSRVQTGLAHQGDIGAVQAWFTNFRSWLGTFEHLAFASQARPAMAECVMHVA